MEKFEKINAEIANWNDSFERLVKHFTNEDYAILMDETNWSDEGAGICYEEAYDNGDWAECLYIYIGDMLKECINMGVKYGTDNLFRLWYENV